MDNFRDWIPVHRDSPTFEQPIFATRVQRIAAVQTHPVPNHAHAPRGPFPPEMQQGNPASEPEIVIDYDQAFPDDGSNLQLGTTAQNKFRAYRWLRCGTCFERVREDQTEAHVCEVIDDGEETES